jgi:aspartate aminotransferase-like enzyme
MAALPPTTARAPGRPYRLRLPGPTEVPVRVLEAIGEELVNHRGPEFRDLLREVQDLARPLIGAENEILIFAGSGTAMMEASIANTVAPGDRVLAIEHGQFGERFAAIAAAYGAHVDVLDVPWGNAPDARAVERELASADYKLVLLTHNESSTGVVADVAAVAAVVRETPALLVVDAVSSLGCMEVAQDSWGADIVVSASQKGLMCPPGIGLVSLGEKAWRIVEEERSTPRFFWDFRKARSSAAKNETPFTPPVSLIRGLRESLEMIHEEGPVQVLARHRRLASALRAGCSALELASFPDPAAASNSVVALSVPDSLDGGAIVKHLYERYRTVIAGSRNRLSGRVIRIGVMGNVSEGDILSDLHFLEATLVELGSNIEAGTGVQAASAALGR